MSTPAAALLHRRWIARFRCHVVARTLCRPGWPRNLPTTCKTRTRTPTTRPLRCGRDGSQATRRVSRRSTGRHRWTLTGCSPSSSARPWRRSGYRRAAPSAPNPTAPLPRPMSGVRLHDLRHTAAVLWLSAGVHFMQVSKWLGHSSYVLTLRTYADYIPEQETDNPLPEPVAPAAPVTNVVQCGPRRAASHRCRWGAQSVSGGSARLMDGKPSTAS